jgi:ATP-dependent Clp protease adaptor protein ClpS
MKFAPQTDVEVLIEEEVVVDEIKLYSIVVFKDTLIDVCEHSQEQAEQCTLIIHFKGKCSVKNGDFEELKPIRNAICQRGISAEISLR